MTKKKDEDTEDYEFLKVFNLHTALLEACDWEEERVAVLVEDALNTYVELYDYSLHDKELIKNNDDFLRLVKINMKNQTTDTEFSALTEVLDYKMKEGLAKVKRVT